MEGPSGGGWRDSLAAIQFNFRGGRENSRNNNCNNVLSRGAGRAHADYFSRAVRRCYAVPAPVAVEIAVVIVVRLPVDISRP